MNISRKRRKKAIKRIQGEVRREARRRERREKERKAGLVRLDYLDGYRQPEKEQAAEKIARNRNG